MLLRRKSERDEKEALKQNRAGGSDIVIEGQKDLLLEKIKLRKK